MTCIKCSETDTNWTQNEDGHYIQKCPECGHTGGPYVSEVTQSAPEEDEEDDGTEVSTMDEWF